MSDKPIDIARILAGSEVRPDGALILDCYAVGIVGSYPVAVPDTLERIPPKVQDVLGRIEAFHTRPPKFRRALAGPATARMAESAGLLEAKPPRDVRSSKVLFEIAYGEFASHLVEDFSKAQSLGCQPPRKSPLAEVHPLGNRLCLRFSVRQKWRDDVLNLCPERTDVGCADRDGFLTTLHHQIVEIRVIANQRQVHHTRVETYFVDRGAKADVAAQELLDFSAVCTMVHETRRNGHDLSADKLAAEPQERDRKGLHQVSVHVPGHPHIGKFNTAARAFDYPQVQRFIGNALVPIQAFEGVAKSLR